VLICKIATIGDGALCQIHHIFQFINRMKISGTKLFH